MAEYKNIIFDLGGVLLNIDYRKTIEAFRKLGIPDAENLYSKNSQTSLFDNLEKGLIPEEEFYSSIRRSAQRNLTDAQIQDAWNALLLDLPVENIQLLKKLKMTYRLFLLSNTNYIHEKAYRDLIVSQYGTFIFDELFEKMYLSHRIHLRKPDAEIFNFVLEDSKLALEETCFIDDSPQHVEGAKKVGLSGYLYKYTGLEEFIKKNLK